jgi:hypothetical protein
MRPLMSPSLGRMKPRAGQIGIVEMNCNNKIMALKEIQIIIFQ